MNPYLELRGELERAGCFTRPRWPFLPEMLLVVAAYAGGYATLLLDPPLLARLGALALVAFAAVQAGFIAHEGSHGALTPNRALSNAIGQGFLTLIAGVSYSWFRQTHRRHHVEPEDPTGPRAYAGTLGAFRALGGRLRGGPRIALLWTLAALRGFGLRVDSLRFVYAEPARTRADRILLGAHFAGWLVVPLAALDAAAVAINYMLLTAFTGLYIGTVLLLNHTAHAPVPPEVKRSYLMRQLATTRNLGDSPLQEFLLVGTSHHVEHHLFPSMPRVHLRKAREITRRFCARRGLVYREMSVPEAVREISRGIARI